MKKFVCTVCGYVHEGDSAPEMCPICKVKAEKFKRISANNCGIDSDSERVKVCDAVKAVIFVLHLYPVFNSAEVAADIEVTCGFNAAEYCLFSIFH